MFDDNEIAQRALGLMLNSNQNIYLTGDAGTGKSTLLKEFVKQSPKKVIILAPTGMAAVNAGGETIHSFCKFGPIPGYQLLQQNKIVKLRDSKLIKSIETLVIDETSMVRSDMLDCLDRFFRVNTGKDHLPFGGIQVILFGDHFQLPPILKRDEQEMFSDLYNSEYFFDARCFVELRLKYVKLTRNYRQSEADFIKLLNYLRYGAYNSDLIQWINQKFHSEPRANSGAITLTVFNQDALEINSQRLERIKENARVYKAEIKGSFKAEMFPTEENLGLKVGSQVMFVKNDPNKKYVNGTVGKITSLGKDTIKVRISTKELEVERVSWEVFHYEFDEEKGEITRKTTGVFLQFPLKLAWAVTIHKSQGQTFDNCIINLGRGAFVTGQTYVAFSRCRKMEGITLSKPIKASDIKTDKRIFEFEKQSQWNK